MIRSNSAGHALFKSHRDQNLSQSAPEDERLAFQVWSAGKVVPFEKLPLQHAVLTGNCVRGSECELRFADGEVRHIAGNVDPLFAVDGSIRGSIGVFLDITRLRMLEQENRLLSREIAHRARNYVSLVQTLARQSLKSKLSRDDYDSFEARLVALGRSVTISLPGSEDAPTVELVVKASIEPLLGTASSRVEIQGPRVPAVTRRRDYAQHVSSRTDDECMQVRRAVELTGKGERELGATSGQGHSDNRLDRTRWSSSRRTNTPGFRHEAPK